MAAARTAGRTVARTAGAAAAAAGAAAPTGGTRKHPRHTHARSTHYFNHRLEMQRDALKTHKLPVQSTSQFFAALLVC